MSDENKDRPPDGRGKDESPIFDRGDGRADWVLNRIGELIAAIDADYMEVCPLLVEARDGKYYVKRGYANMEEFALGTYRMHRRKLYYLMGIEDRLVKQAGIPRERLGVVPWSAAKELAALPLTELANGRADVWLARAAQLTVGELADEVRRVKQEDRAGAPRDGNGSEATEVFKPFSVRLAPGQMERVLLALEIAGKMDGSDKRCHLLDIICADFIAGRHKEVGLKLQVILLTLEDAFEVELLAMRIKGSERECVYSSRGLKKYLTEGQGA